VVVTDGRIVEVQVGRERWALPSRKSTAVALAPAHHDRHFQDEAGVLFFSRSQ
jgi:hypothetical protein